MYENKKVYGPYTRKDGRQVVILKTPGSNKDHQTISYPKYLVEQHLKRYLTADETVDHIDGDFTNNELSNLRVVNREEHCRSHISKREVLTKICTICGKSFETNNVNRTTCGSKSCRGKCAHINGFNQGNSFTYDRHNKLIDMRDSITYIKSVVN